MPACPLYLTREQARTLDRRAIEELGIPGIVLMENAGRRMAELIRSLGIGGPVVVCCGKGKNGGDGLVIARHLANAGATVRILLFADPEQLPGDARTNYGIVARMGALKGGPGLEVVPGDVNDTRLRDELAAADWVVDALFGSGLRGAVPPPFDRIIAAINAGPARILAVDVPSGVDSNSGVPAGPTVRAHHTATVAAPKKGFREPTAAQWLGEVHVIDMGCPPELLAKVAG
jgi:NAD(P)H-hydrate epimerase